MTDLMQIIYEHISRSRVPGFIDYTEYEPVTRRLERLGAEVSAALPAGKQETFRSYLDAQRERFSIDLEAMFRAAFAAARELG